MTNFIANLIYLLSVLVAAIILLCPLYFMVTSSPWCIFMFFISWFPAAIVGKIGIAIGDAIKG